MSATYRHTQKGPWYVLLLLFASVTLVLGITSSLTILPSIMIGCIAGILFVLAGSFRSLTIFDQFDSLAVQFGPLPLFRKSIPYGDITNVELGRSSLIDGWGIHWFPGRGWTYNIWGFDCVIVHCGRKVIRLGSDDSQALFEFLKQKLSG
ncbi:MAG: hypothetical protein NXI32_23645 [bacterium]|nr:hypothetical protein [bacterium]